MTAQPTLPFDQPRARRTDPDTSHEAAASVRWANDRRAREIRDLIRERGPLSQEDIARELGGGRDCTFGTIVTACARARLVPVGEKRNARGRRVKLWDIELS